MQLLVWRRKNRATEPTLILKMRKTICEIPKCYTLFGTAMCITIKTHALMLNAMQRQTETDTLHCRGLRKR